MTTHEPVTSDELVLEHMPLVGRIVGSIARRLPRHVTQDDLRQVGYIGLLDAARRFDPNKGASFSSFAGHRIHGAVLDELRAIDPVGRYRRERTGPRQMTEQLRTQTLRFDDPALLVDAIAMVWLRREIRRFRPRLRRFMLLHYYGGLTAADAGRRMNVGQVRACQLRDEGLLKLRQRMYERTTA